jgi:hypothetical protein
MSFTLSYEVSTLTRLFRRHSTFVLRAARVARGPAVTPDDLAASGLEPRTPPRPEPTPLAPAAATKRRRAPRRWARKH